MRKRKPFVMIELFLALSIVSIALIPIVSQPFLCYKKQVKSLQAIELERFAELAYIEMLSLLSNETQISDIGYCALDSVEYSLEPCVVCIDKVGNFTYNKKAKLWIKNSPKGENPSNMHLLACQIEFEPELSSAYQPNSPYLFHFLVSKSPDKW